MENNTSASAAPKMTWLQKIKRIFTFISVEPVMICWAFPAFMMFSSYENISIEKVCRQDISNTSFSKDLCTVLVRKDEFGISCALDENGTLPLNDIDTDGIGAIFPALTETVNQSLTEFVSQICSSETIVQDKLAFVYTLRGNLAAIVPLIIVLFAGSWSDKKGVRKPLMFFPIVGELLACVVCLLSAIFMDSIPAEVPAFGTRVLPSLFGAEQLMLIGLFSYMTAISSEEDRTLRFGIFSVIFSLVPIFATPLSHVLYIHLGYINLCLVCIVIFILGLIYTAFVLKEITSVQSTESTIQLPMGNGSTDDVAETGSKNFCAEFFDIRLVKECLAVLFKPRENFMRTVFILVLLTYILNYLVPNGEGTVLFLFLRVRFDWDTAKYSSYLSFTGFLGLIGTIFMVGVLSKLLKFSDPILVLISVSLAVVSRIVQAIATTGKLFYAGAIVDFSGPSKYTALRSIVSKIVLPNEIGSAFSILTITEPLVGLVTPLIYGFTYHSTFEKHPNTIFWLGAIFHALALAVFIFTYRILRKYGPKDDPKTDPEKTEMEKKDESVQSTKL